MTVAEIVRKWYNDKNVSNEEYRELHSQLKKMCGDYLKSGKWNFDEEDILDIVSVSMQGIYKSLRSNDFWKNLDSKADEQVTSYIYGVIRTSVNDSPDKMDKQNSRIVNAISKELSELEKKGEITRIGLHFGAKGTVTCKEFFDGNILLPYQSLIRGETQISHSELSEYMRMVISKLGTKCFTKSDMIHLVRENTDEFGFTKIEPEETEIKYTDNDPVDFALMDQMLMKFEKCFSESERIENALIFVSKVFYQLSLDDIIDILKSCTGWKKSSLQSISNVMKNVTVRIGLINATDDNSERIKLIREFSTCLSEKYISADLHEHLQSIKNKRYKE